MKEQPERRQSDFPDIWQKIGKHDEAIDTLKSATLQTRQDFVGHKAETLAIVHEHKLETSTMVQRIEDKMEAAWDSIAIKLNTLQKFQWTILIGGRSNCQYDCGRNSYRVADID